MKKFLMIIAVIVVILLSVSMIISSCYIFSFRTEENSETWTVLVYMGGDNDLSKFTVMDLNEMEVIGSTSKVDVIVLYDASKNQDSKIYHINKDPNGKNENVISNIIDDGGAVITGGEVNIADPNTLINFVKWSITNYPSDHYFLDLWDHGKFYEGSVKDKSDYLTLQEMELALEEITNWHGDSLDLIGFDCCRMGAVEILYSLNGYADYVVASEKDEPGDGWDYEKVLEKMNSDDVNTGEEVGRAVVDSYVEWTQYIANFATTLALYDMNYFSEFMDIFNQAIEDFMNLTKYYQQELRSIAYNTEKYSANNADLVDFLEEVVEFKDLRLSLRAEEMLDSLDDLINYFKKTDVVDPSSDGHVTNAHGLAIYLPTYVPSSSYGIISFAKETKWDEFLNYLNGDYVFEKHNGIVNVTMTDLGDEKEVGFEYWIDDVEEIELNIYYKDLEIIDLNVSESVYNITLGYGIYEYSVYGYSDGIVVWVGKGWINHTKTMNVTGVVNMDGEVLKDVEIFLETSDGTFGEFQTDDGFRFVLLFPRDVKNESEINITTIYDGYFFKETIRINDNNDNINVGALNYSTYKIDFIYLLIFSTLTSLIIAVFFNIYRNSKNI